MTDTEKFVTGNYLEVGKGLPYRKICFQNYIGNNFGQDGNFAKATNNLFAKRIPSHAPLQTGTNQWLSGSNVTKKCSGGIMFVIPPVRLILHPFSNFFELISPAGYIAATLQ